MLGRIFYLLFSSAGAFTTQSVPFLQRSSFQMASSFSEDFLEEGRGISSFELRQVSEAQRRRAIDRTGRFLHGDDLHKLRQHILSLRTELETMRERGALGRVSELEQAILFAQSLDAEFVYATATERANNALLVGDLDVAREFQTQARHARNALPQFNLDGLWVGKYGKDGFSMINVTYSGDTLIAYKVTGDQDVPKGDISFVADLGIDAVTEDVLEPIQLTEDAAVQWGSHFLQRFVGKGQTVDQEWMEGQLILVNEYFSFAWLPKAEQVFFGRPTAELTLKLLRNDRTWPDEIEEDEDEIMRAHLERCYEESHHWNNELERNEESLFVSNDQTYFYSQEGCFE